jgi:hypothetical protein
MPIPQIILQPAGQVGAHYEATILNPVRLSRIAHHLPKKVLEQLSEIYPNDEFPVWGATPGSTGANLTKWNRIQAGDFVLFARAKIYISFATVTYKIRNANAARVLWGEDEHGSTWEYLFFLRDLQDIRIPYRELNRAAGYNKGYMLPGLNVLDAERSKRVAESLKLDRSHGPVELKRLEADLDLIGDLDRQEERRQRAEQRILRKYIFKGADHGKCAICGTEFPIGLLVAAHVKRRCECTDEEKRDIIGNIVPMCRFGCDELFERMYITVEKGGNIVPGSGRPMTTAVGEYMAGLVGLVCRQWNENRAPYFMWHRTKASAILTTPT